MAAPNKRGGNLGGVSTGSGTPKRGGGASTPNPEDAVDRGPLTCPRCDGTGHVGNESAEADQTGVFSGLVPRKCPRCEGLGSVDAR